MKRETLVGTACIWLLSCSPAAQPEVERLQSPAGGGSAQPSLAVGPGGAVYLSWQEPGTGDTRLRFAAWSGESFGDARTIAHGPDLLANWADFPSLAVGPDGTITAHWMVRRDQRYSYDIYLARSSDQGETWTSPGLLHKDGKLAEHGFVSFVSYPDGALGAVWLDGREMAAEQEASGPGDKGHGAAEGGHGASGGAMTVRYAEIDGQGRPQGSTVLDARVCECCQTDAAATSRGAVAVFRDRSEGEVRDIGVAVLNRTVRDGSATGTSWRATQRVSEDGWEIAGCPVNGPRLDADGERVALAWFTMGADARPRVKTAFSDDGGLTFSTPSIISEGATIGRLDTLILPDGSAVVALVEFPDEDADEPDLRLKRITPDGTLTHTFTIAPSSTRRPAGFPRLALSGQHIYITWTDLTANKIQLARIAWPE